MQRLITVLFISLFSLTTFSESQNHSEKKQQVVFVYISASKSAKCYHASPKCQALRKSRKILKVSLSDAQKTKKACKHCYYTPSHKFPANRSHLDEPPLREPLPEDI